MKCQVKGCSLDAICKVEKLVSRLSVEQEDYLIWVYIPVCSEHLLLLVFRKKELGLPLEE